jgi:hypothetical protein
LSVSLEDAHDGAPGPSRCIPFAATASPAAIRRRKLRHLLAAVVLAACGAFVSSADAGASAWPRLEQAAASVDADHSVAGRTLKRPHQWLRYDNPPAHDLNLEEDVQPKTHGAAGPRTDAAPPLSDQGTGDRMVMRGVAWIGSSAPPRGPPSPFAS